MHPVSGSPVGLTLKSAGNLNPLVYQECAGRAISHSKMDWNLETSQKLPACQRFLVYGKVRMQKLGARGWRSDVSGGREAESGDRIYASAETGSAFFTPGVLETKGSRISTINPLGRRLEADTFPPWNRTARWVIASPKPTPPVWRPRASSRR